RLLILLVPSQIQPAKPLKDRVERRFGIAFDVGVVDAQDHGPAVAAGGEAIEDECGRGSDVQKNRRRRRKPDSGHENKSITAASRRLVYEVLLYSQCRPEAGVIQW